VLPDRPIVVDLKPVLGRRRVRDARRRTIPTRRLSALLAPTGHRHEAEVRQALGIGMCFVGHVYRVGCGGCWRRHMPGCGRAFTDKELWRAYRRAYGSEPFVRIVHDRSGIYRHPEPKLLAGTNLADVGWEVDAATGRLVALAAIDNLGKGAAGTAVQCMNLMLGFDETTGLEFTGLHPV